MNPAPIPDTVAPKYSSVSVSAYAFKVQPTATMMPPTAIVYFGPNRDPSVSTIQPPAGVSQVSSAMKMLNAHWISAMLQPCACLIGCTNSVQPYCKFAISIMLITPNRSCIQRLLVGLPVARLADIVFLPP